MTPPSPPPPPSTMPVPAQLALGAGIAAGAYGLMIVLAVAGVPLGLWAWALVFATLWVVMFVALRKRMMAFLVGFVVTAGSIYLFLAARGFRV